MLIETFAPRCLNCARILLKRMRSFRRQILAERSISTSGVLAGSLTRTAQVTSWAGVDSGSSTVLYTMHSFCFSCCTGHRRMTEGGRESGPARIEDDS